VIASDANERLCSTGRQSSPLLSLLQSVLGNAQRLGKLGLRKARALPGPPYLPTTTAAWDDISSLRIAGKPSKELQSLGFGSDLVCFGFESRCLDTCEHRFTVCQRRMRRKSNSKRLTFEVRRTRPVQPAVAYRLDQGVRPHFARLQQFLEFASHEFPLWLPH
jgi:hypothetical protein